MSVYGIVLSRFTGAAATVGAGLAYGMSPMMGIKGVPHPQNQK